MELLKDLQHLGSEEDRLRHALENEGLTLKRLNDEIVGEFKILRTAILQSDDALRKGGDLAVLKNKIGHFRRVFRSMEKLAARLKNRPNLRRIMIDLEKYCATINQNLDALKDFLDANNKRPQNAEKLMKWMIHVLDIAKSQVSSDIKERYTFIERSLSEAA